MVSSPAGSAGATRRACGGAGEETATAGKDAGRGHRSRDLSSPSIPRIPCAPGDAHPHAGLGVIGDRHFAHPAHRQASVTLQSVEALEHVAAELGVPVPGLTETRRNVLLRGIDVDALVGVTFALDSGAGPVRFRAHRPANPCAWMNEAIAPGAHRALLRRGEPLTDGALALGRAVLTVEPAEVSRR